MSRSYGRNGRLGPSSSWLDGAPPPCSWGLNAFLAARAGRPPPRLWLGLAAAVGFLFGLALQGEWERVLLALNAEPFDVRDPLFSLDVGWYAFQWPLWTFLQETAQWGLVPLAALFPLVLPVPRRWRWAHLSTLAALFFLLMAVGYRFDAYRLLYGERTVAFGAGYADVHARLPVLNLLSALMVLLAAGCCSTCGCAGRPSWP
jgi:uncharacterized protein